MNRKQLKGNLSKHLDFSTSLPFDVTSPNRTDYIGGTCRITKEYIDYVLSKVEIDGNWLEFGVYTGSTINYLI